MNVLTDARGATTTFGYNARHLVTGLTYGVPVGVAGTSNVSFAYDAAGNRTLMTDGLGSASYVYDQLSRLTSETRTFTGVVGPFPLSYQYNLAGELTGITGPSQFGSVNVGYQYDKVGRVTSVTGANYAGVSNYINSISYRAFGAAKQVAYNNGKTLSLAYDNRLRLTQWNIPSVLGYSYSYNYFNENSGRPTFASNLTSGPTGRDAALDRSYDYDQVGRLLGAYTGTSALAHTGQGSTWGSDGPYAQSFTYDPWGNITARAGWGGEHGSYSATFNSNNRMSAGFAYDASGNVTSDGGQTFSYDATGQEVTASIYNSSFSYDGNGLREKKIENGVTTYYLRSSVLGGQVVAEINSSGGWTRGYVYLGGQTLAIQYNSQVTWVHQEPVTKGQRLTDSVGNITSIVELDPWGGNISTWAGGAKGTLNVGSQPHRYTTYERDLNQSDDAMYRHYNRWWSRFDQPDPYDGSYDLTDPQSFNRYSYVQNDPVNFVDPSGLEPALTCLVDGMPSNCGLAFGLVGMGFGRVWGGWGGFYGDYLVVDHFLDGGYSYQSVYYFGQPQDTRTTCERFADRVQELANAATSRQGLFDSLARTFMSQSNGHPTNSSLSEMHAAQGGVFVGEARQFVSEDGIRAQFQGGQGGQIRHFVGALIAASYPFGTLAMVLREGLQTDRDSRADRRLNTLAGYIYETVFTRPLGDRGARYEVSLENVRKTLADEIRRDLCGP